MAKRTAVIAGATGVVGRTLLEHLLAEPDWNVVAVSRRRPDVPGDYRHVAADLTDIADCRAKFAGVGDATHVFFAAFAERSDPQEHVRVNTALLANLVDAVEASAADLQHVHLVEGTKWYGSHLGPFKTPAKEDDPRHLPPNFYYSQEDHLEAAQRGKRWTWSASRPHAVCGFALGSPMNLVTLIAVYAAICKELRVPFAFPGNPGAYRALYQCVDAQLLARAMVWMATQPQCANEAFNITNGDLIRWEHLWPKLARCFEMEAAPLRHISLARTMADKGPVWDRIVERHGLKPNSYESIAAWPFGDYVFGCEYDIISDLGKLRRTGFNACVDTEEMFLRLFSGLREQRIVP